MMMPRAQEDISRREKNIPSWTTLKYPFEFYIFTYSQTDEGIGDIDMKISG
jgi:hypothetical protein